MINDWSGNYKWHICTLIYAFEHYEMSSYHISNLDQTFIDYKLQTCAVFYKICGKYIEAWLSDLTRFFSFDKFELGRLKIFMIFCVRKKTTALIVAIIFANICTYVICKFINICKHSL